MMLAASSVVCRWCVDRFDVRRTVPVRTLMGLVAFLVLVSAEVGLGAALGRSLVGSACQLRLAFRCDRSGRSRNLRHVPGNLGLAAVEPRSLLPIRCGPSTCPGLPVPKRMRLPNANVSINADFDFAPEG